ncbi:uncharacterized protein LOC132464920 [Gadus macrocephalus]|uniref:uncharacterized protein LOC132464920 n=1 Tax=Gadus macrocephalus TaxID=80720 RepID=UPI0028CB6A91|nr:uncharacterized protein LOC132464920 [Gadus macrocephalus]
MVGELEGLEGPGVVWGGGGGGGGGGSGHVEELQRELKRLQRKVRNTLDDWLEFYRIATGLRCPDIERLPGAPRRARRPAPAAPPSLKPPGWEDPRPGHPPTADPPRHLSAAGGFLLRASTRDDWARTPRRPVKEESRVTQVGALRVHSNIRLESFIIPRSPARPPADGADPPVPTPSSPCPALLRATLQRDGGAARDGRPQGGGGDGGGGGGDVIKEQCQMDSFRLVRYEVSAGRTGPARRSLLQIRHSVAPGTLLMYIRGKLLFADHVPNCSRGSIRSLHRQISTSRRDFRLGLSLPADYKISAKLKGSVAADSLSTLESWPMSTSLDLSETRLRHTATQDPISSLD